jgi:hypothetical protein
LEAGFNLKVERGFVGKDNFDNVVIGREGQFHFGNDLAFCLREFEDALVSFRLVCSHGSPFDRRGFVVRVA